MAKIPRNESTSTTLTRVISYSGKSDELVMDELDRQSSEKAELPTYAEQFTVVPVEHGFLERHREVVANFYTKNSKIFKWIILTVLAGCYIGYLSYVVYLNYERSRPLLYGSLAVLVLMIYFNVIKPLLQESADKFIRAASRAMKPHQRKIKMAMAAAFIVALAVFIGVDTASNPSRLRALAGIGLFLGLGVLFSHAPSRINLRIIFAGIAFQFLFGLVVLRWDAGKQAFEWTGNALQNILSFASFGSKFVFQPGELHHNMAFTVMPVLLFASFLIAILYHIGAMGWFVEKVGWAIYICLGTTAAESISAAANVFLGMTEAPLTIKPYLNILTKSELLAVMAGGFATISGSLLVTYAAMGVEPKYLLAASVMNAPAALVMAKLLFPETEQSRTHFKNMTRDSGTAYNVLDAAMAAASSAVQAIGNILAALICAVSFMALVDAVLSYVGWLADYQGQLSLAVISGYIFYPVAFLMGAEARECQTIGQLLGYKTFLNEFVAYAELETILKNTPHILSEKGKTIVTYALCGFSNFSSIGIQLGNFSIMAPDRKKDLVALVLRALFAGFSANMLTASIAGLLIDEGPSNPLNSGNSTSLSNFTTTTGSPL